MMHLVALYLLAWIYWPGFIGLDLLAWIYWIWAIHARSTPDGVGRLGGIFFALGGGLSIGALEVVFHPAAGQHQRRNHKKRPDAKSVHDSLSRQ
jgi:hypothetical protein